MCLFNISMEFQLFTITYFDPCHYICVIGYCFLIVFAFMKQARADAEARKGRKRRRGSIYLDKIVVPYREESSWRECISQG